MILQTSSACRGQSTEPISHKQVNDGKFSLHRDYDVCDTIRQAVSSCVSLKLLMIMPKQPLLQSTLLQSKLAFQKVHLTLTVLKPVSLFWAQKFGLLWAFCKTGLDPDPQKQSWQTLHDEQPLHTLPPSHQTFLACTFAINRSNCVPAAMAE